MKANELRPGNAVKVDGNLYMCIKIDHVKPGKGPAYLQAKFRAVTGAGTMERRFNSSEIIEDVMLDRREMEYLYSDSHGATFMDPETYDQTVIDADLLGDALLYLSPNAQLMVMCHEGNPITVELPAAVDLTIAETTPTVKGATATNQLKEATCDTGLKTRVPPFIEIGEVIKISTADGSYMSRSKGD